MSDQTATDKQSVQPQQQQQQQNAGAVTSETSTTNPNSAPVQYQIQPNVSTAEQTTATTDAAPIQQQYVYQPQPPQPSSTYPMPPQQGGIMVPPNVSATATFQQLGYSNIPQTNVTQQQSTQPPAIKPLLSPEPLDQVDASADNNPKQPANNAVPTNQEQKSQQQQQQQTSPQTKSDVAKLRFSDELNIFDWFKATEIINQLAEKAKTSMDTVITALDPGMKEYLYSGGNINILVIGDFDKFVSPIRDAFQRVFGRATVAPAKTSTPEVSSFPIKLAHGFSQAIKVAQERIKQLRLDTSHIPQNQVVITVQPTIVDVLDSDSEQLLGLKVDENLFTGCYLTYCLVLEDPVLKLTLTSYSQLIPLDVEAKKTLNSSKLPDESPHHNLGYTITIDDMMNTRLKITPQEEDHECQWLWTWAGLQSSQLMTDVGSTLAHLYRRKWTDCVT